MQHFILSVCCRLSDVQFFYRIFIDLYKFFVYAFTIYLKHLQGVEFIYLRRGVAKTEFIPFLSDIDMTIIVDKSANIKEIQRRISKLQKVFPILEPQSQVIEKEKFLSLMSEENFAKNMAILFRILEAKFTWKLLYSKQQYNIVDKIELPISSKITTLVLSEALYWHGIVVSEYCNYILSKQRKLNYFQRKRLCWVFMKATCEFTNLFNGLLNQKSLVFNRRKIIQQTKAELTNSKWIRLFNRNELILNNQFDIQEIDSYLKDAFAYLSFLYKKIFKELTTKLKNDWETIEWYRKHCYIEFNGKPPKIHQIDLSKITIPKMSIDTALSAIFITPQPINNTNIKVLIIIVIQYLNQKLNKTIYNLINEIRNQLKSQKVYLSETEINIVDHHGFLCFGVPRQFGLNTKCLIQRNEAYKPSLYSMLFDNSIKYDQSQKIIANYFKEGEYS